MSARVITVANNKGGVGKSALTANLGAAFALKGYKTLLIDFDAQANLTDNFVAEEDVEKFIGKELAEGRPLPTMNIKENLYLAPSNNLTANLQRKEVETLKNALQPVLSLYDIVLIDTPPTVGTLTLSALLCANDVIVPLTAEYFAYKGLKSINEIVQSIQQGGNSTLRLSAAVLCMYEERKRLHRAIKEFIETTFPHLLCESTIRSSIAVAEAVFERKDIFSYNKRGRKSAEDFSALSAELVSKLHI